MTCSLVVANADITSSPTTGRKLVLYHLGSPPPYLAQLATGEHPYEALTSQQETEMKFWTLVLPALLLRGCKGLAQLAGIWRVCQ